MHVLYVDDSGSVRDTTQTYFVLGAVAVYERGIYHLIKAADECVASFGFADPDEIELHGTDMYAGKGKPWHDMKVRADREILIHEALGTLIEPNASVRLFAVAVDKAGVSPRDPVEVAFCGRRLDVAKFEWSQQPDERWPPDYEPFKHGMEFPANIKALETVGDRCFAILDDGRTVDITGIFDKPDETH